MKPYRKIDIIKATYKTYFKYGGNMEYDADYFFYSYPTKGWKNIQYFINEEF